MLSHDYLRSLYSPSKVQHCPTPYVSKRTAENTQRVRIKRRSGEINKLTAYKDEKQSYLK